MRRRNLFKLLNGGKEKPPGICEVLGGEIVDAGYCEREGMYGPYWGASFSMGSLQGVIADEHPLAGRITSDGGLIPYHYLRKNGVIKDEDVRELRDDDVLFFDIESAGNKRKMPIFLIGMGYFQREKPRFELLLARDYSEEAAILAAFFQRSRQFDYLCSFNGKSYDLPELIARAKVKGVQHPMAAPEKHIDLLGIARRIEKKILGSKRLGDLETVLLGFERENDLKSAQVPRAYREFVATQHPGDIKKVIRHTALDVMSLMSLYLHYFHASKKSA